MLNNFFKFFIRFSRHISHIRVGSSSTRTKLTAILRIRIRILSNIGTRVIGLVKIVLVHHHIRTLSLRRVHITHRLILSNILIKLTKLIHIFVSIIRLGLINLELLLILRLLLLLLLLILILTKEGMGHVGYRNEMSKKD